MWKPDICIYHGGCDDGFGAAYAVWKRWGDEVAFVEGRYGEAPPNVYGKHVIIVDFSYKREVMREIGNRAQSVVVLDHHKTAQAELHEWGSSIPANDLGDRLEATEFDIDHVLMQNCLPIIAWFDMNKSGARMAWEFCHPGTDVPRLILHVEDRDLWRFALPYTKHVSAALRSYKHSFDRWDAWCHPNDDVSPLIMDGGAILRAHEKNVEQHCTNVYEDEIGGVRVPVVNVPYHYASDCADALLKAKPDAPFAAAWFRRGDGVIQYSLRSRDDRMDVSEIAKQYGGGGHRNAAGFQMQAPT